MATKKTAIKTTKRASVNISVASNRKSKRTTRTIQKNLKKTSFKAIAISLAFLLVGAGCGAGAWFIACRNDCFNLVGKDEITLTLDKTYKEQGVKIIAFGKDDSNNFTTETNLLKNENGDFYATEEGTYYIKYKTTNVKYSSIFTIEKVRLITFVEPSEQEEFESANQE